MYFPTWQTDDLKTTEELLALNFLVLITKISVKELEKFEGKYLTNDFLIALKKLKKDKTIKQFTTRSIYNSIVLGGPIYSSTIKFLE
ncbi:MAG: hypothetical protein JSU07_05695 [Bacteroidetes bacterium]|nr:hypothetical protein [Bacteroidota bacterium]